MSEQGQTAIETINQAIDRYRPAKVFSLFSGGDDSICATHVAAQASQFDGAVMIDTGIAVAQTHEHVRAVCERFGWPLLVYRSPYSYDDLVRKHGFPGPAQHTVMYSKLKERAIRSLVRDHKKERGQQVMLITGVRQQESQRRMVTVQTRVDKRGAQIWVSPLFDWTNERKTDYMREHNLPRNPVKPFLHVSGDCLCGAFAQRGELEMLRMFYPTEYARIKALQDEVAGQFPWGWDETPPEWFIKIRHGQMPIEVVANDEHHRLTGEKFMPLCWACARRGGN